jgi:hypothetical protein
MMGLKDAFKVSWTDKDNGSRKELEVPGWADMAVKADRLRKDGHGDVNVKRSKN